MIDPDAFAALLCDWCLEVQPGRERKLVPVVARIAEDLSKPAIATLASAGMAAGALMALSQPRPEPQPQGQPQQPQQAQQAPEPSTAGHA